MEYGFFWSLPFLGKDLYHIGISFVVYSILGWCAESIYMSFCNKKLTNRGIAKGPFCPIYGVGATLGSIALEPFSHSFFLVYVIGAVIATIFEYIVGKLMLKSLGSMFWTYDDKPFNYQGIICLESTLAWGFYAIGVVEFLNKFLFKTVERFEPSKVIIFMEVVLAIAVVDYIFRGISIARGKISGEKTA